MVSFIETDLYFDGMPHQFSAEVEKLSSGFADEIVLRDGD